MPNLEVLDLTDNQIMILSQLENLKKLTHLAEVSVKENPICIHKSVVEMIYEQSPHIETVNFIEIKEAGHKYK